MSFSDGPRPCPLSRWQLLQARSWKSLAPRSAMLPSVPPPASHAWYCAGSITTTVPIMPECFVPQYSAQKIG